MAEIRYLERLPSLPAIQQKAILQGIQVLPIWITKITERQAKSRQGQALGGLILVHKFRLLADSDIQAESDTEICL